MTLLRRLTTAAVALTLLLALLVSAALAAGTALPTAELAFVAQKRDGGSDVYLLDAARLTFTPLTHSQFPKEAPIWSPTGQRLAFTGSSWRGGSQSGVYVVDLDGHRLRRVAAGAAQQSSLTWSPDGRQIAYTSFHEGRFTVFALDVDDGQMRTLAESSAALGSPIWSPDGARVALVAHSGSDDGLYLVAATGGSPVRLTMQAAYAPTWSPDSRELAYIATDKGNTEVFTLPADCGNTASGCVTAVRNLTQNSAYDAFPVWSPDGRAIAFYSTRDCQEVSLFMMALDGGPARRLLSNCALSLRGTTENLAPSWSPDGREIAVTSQDGNMLNIYSVAVADGAVRRLTNLADFHVSVQYPAWRP